MLQVYHGPDYKWCITDAIKFVQTNKEKQMSAKEDDKDSKEPNYDEDKDQQQEKETEGLKEETINQVF